MSGIYIHGMEMPTEKTDVLIIAIQSDGSVFPVHIDEEGNPMIFQNEEMQNRAVPVPEHGRLGDLDAAVELAIQYCPDDDGSCSKADSDLRELLDEIESLPTIIPADKEGEG